MNKKTSYKISLCAIFTALALLSFILESLFPPIIIPGARLGVSNVFILLCVITLGVKYGMCALILKCTLGSIFAGNLSAILYSLPAGFIALGIEILLLQFSSKISIVAISVVGGVTNNIVQNLTFCIITKTYGYFIYLPYLALIGIVSGLAVGLIVYLLIKKLPSSLFTESVNENKFKEK